MIGTEKEDVIKWENCIDHYISMFIVPIIETNEEIIDKRGRHKTHGVNQVPHGLLDHWLLVPKIKPPHHSWLTVTNMCLIYIQQGLIEWLGNKCHPTHASTRGTTPKRPASHHQRPANSSWWFTKRTLPPWRMLNCSKANARTKKSEQIDRFAVADWTSGSSRISRELHVWFYV